MAAAGNVASHVAPAPHGTRHPCLHAGKATMRQQLQQHLRHQTQQLRGLGEYLRRNLKILVELCLNLQPSPATADAAAGQPQPQRQVQLLELERLRFVLTPSGPRQGGANTHQHSLHCEDHTHSDHDTPSAVWRTHAPAPRTTTRQYLQHQRRGMAAAVRCMRNQRCACCNAPCKLLMLCGVAARASGGTIGGMIPAFAPGVAAVPMDLVVASLRQLWFEEVLQSPRVGTSSPAGAWSAAACPTLMTDRPSRSSRGQRAGQAAGRRFQMLERAAGFS